MGLVSRPKALNQGGYMLVSFPCMADGMQSSHSSALGGLLCVTHIQHDKARCTNHHLGAWGRAVVGVGGGR